MTPSFDALYWKLFNLWGRIFGGASIVVGGILTLDGILQLLKAARSGSGDIQEYVLTIFVSLAVIVMGICFLKVKPYFPSGSEKKEK